MTFQFHKGQRVELYRPPPPAGTILEAMGSRFLVEWGDGSVTWVDDFVLVPEPKTRRSK